MSEKKGSGMASLVIVLAIICLVVAALLGVVNNVTAAPIAANNEKTVQESLLVVLPADEYTQVEYTGDNTAVVAVYQAGDAGYVVEVMSPNGFSGGIDMMTGIDPDGAVTGIAVISHAETSGLGSKAQTDKDWQAQFVGLTDTAAVTKDGGTINAITGSTITSRAICDGVNIAREVVEALG